jgi:protein TonB
MKTWHAPLESPRADHKIALRLFGFVLASMMLHAIVLLSQRTSFEPGVMHERTMQVTLGSLTPIESPAATKPAEKKPPAKQTPQPERARTPMHTVPTARSLEQTLSESREQLEDRQPLAATAVASPPQGTTNTTTAVATTSADAVGGEQQRSTLNQLLKQALAKHFHYPLLARKRGWQGEVRLSFTLDTSGTNTHARIAQGSGYSALDHAALKSLNQVARIDEHLTQELNFELPVVYTLNEG